MIDSDQNKILNDINKLNLLIYPLIFIIIIYIITVYDNVYQAAVNLNNAYNVGKRENSECGFEFMEAETPNFQIYQLIDGDYKNKGFNLLYNANISLINVWKYLSLISILSIIIVAFIIIRVYYRKDTDIFPRKKLYFMIIVILFILHRIIIKYKDILVYKKQNETDLQLSTWNISSTGKITPPTPVYLIITLLLIFIYSKSIWAIVLLLIYIFLYISIYIIKTNSISIINVVNNNYLPHITTIQSTIINMLNSSLTPSNIVQTVQDYFKRNIKRLEQIDGDDGLLDPPRLNYLWKYIMHQNGKELDILCPNDANRITIMNELRALRNEQNIIKITKQFINRATVLFSILSIFIFYATFHLIYNISATSASLLIGLLVIIIAILGPWYGILMNIVTN